MSPKTRGYVYREAARRIENRGDSDQLDYLWSCTAIEAVCGGDAVRSKPLEQAYVMVFAPEGSHYPAMSLQHAFGVGSSHEAAELRILALCFMAAMVEAGDA